MFETVRWENNWRDYLSKEYTWASTMKLGQTNAPVAGAIHFLIADELNPDDESPKVTLTKSVFDDNWKKDLETAAANSGWKPSANGTCFIQHQGFNFLLVVPTQLKVTSSQKSRQLGLDFAKALKNIKTNRWVFVARRDACILGMMDGLTMGFYEVGFLKSKKKKTSDTSSALPQNVDLWGGKLPEEKWVQEFRAHVESVSLTRFLQDAPPNYLTPERFANIIEDISKASGFKCEILGPEEMSAKGMGSFVSVANGSTNEPRLISVEIPGTKPSKNKVALVGKGLTFDSGGISLKPGNGMQEMKYDMSGGAACAGALHFFGKIKPEVDTVCLIGATENMPSSTATRPSDVVAAMNGKTIEVNNTDAEGRLVLADVLCYAQEKYKATHIIDIATLTGAVLSALGHAGAAVVSNDQDWTDRILKHSKTVGEPLWQLPLWPELVKEVKGETSDLQNIAKPNVMAGTIMGGLFLQEFINKDVKWAHLDIAGTAWQCSATGFPQPSSGFGLRTMADICCHWDS